MPDFECLQWTKQSTDGDVVQAIRRNVRKRRTERGRAGHRFASNYLKTVWAASDGIHVVLNHVDDTAWQMWYDHPAEGWMMINWHPTRREAQAMAESRRPEIVEAAPEVRPGINVLAGWDTDAYRDRALTLPMRVPCSSEYTASEIEGIFERLGCVTRREHVAAE